MRNPPASSRRRMVTTGFDTDLIGRDCLISISGGGGSPLTLGKHGLRLDTGAGIYQVVAEEDLRRCRAGSTIFSHVFGTDVDGS